MNIPESPAALTAEWLTAALRERGVITDASVQSFEMKPVNEGGTTGLLGEHARLRLIYDKPETGAPQQMYAKFSLSDPELRALAHKWGYYETEVRFYDQIAAQSELRTPRCYYSALNNETGACVLLLEDLAPARNIDMASGCSPDQAKLAVEAIAKFHAIWWESPELAKLGWLSNHDVQVRQSAYQRAWDPFVEKVGHRVPEVLLDLAVRFAKDVGVLYNSHRETPQTIIHGDYHLENLFFASPEGGVPFAVIDWQIATRGHGVMDVAYLLVTGLQSADRKAHEMDILRGYHRTLLENGVRGYSFDQCLLDYRLNILRTLHIFIGAIGLALPEGTARFDAFYDAWLPRVHAALIDHNVAEFLPE